MKATARVAKPKTEARAALRGGEMLVASTAHLRDGNTPMPAGATRGPVDGVYERGTIRRVAWRWLSPRTPDVVGCDPDGFEEDGVAMRSRAPCGWRCGAAARLGLGLAKRYVAGALRLLRRRSPIGRRTPVVHRVEPLRLPGGKSV